jgi:beta-phosphoglucomutase-like phosphatase (HAD superfamily)
MIDKKNVPIKAIIFDMDGTIVDTEKVWDFATKKPLFDRGILEFSAEEEAFLDSFSGIGIEDWAVQVKSFFKLDDHHDLIASEAVANAAQGFDDIVPFIEGFERFHAFVKDSQLEFAVATNTGRQAFDAIIEKMNFKHFFGRHLYCKDDVAGLAKPNPALFLYAADRLGVAPEECLVIEDSIFGFEAASLAGMRCIAIKNKRNKDHIHHADYAVNDYHEAFDLLTEMFALQAALQQQVVTDIQQLQ